jgi:hypothetical protein
MCSPISRRHDGHARHERRPLSRSTMRLSAPSPTAAEHIRKFKRFRPRHPHDADRSVNVRRRNSRPVSKRRLHAVLLRYGEFIKSWPSVTSSISRI